MEVCSMLLNSNLFKLVYEKEDLFTDEVLKITSDFAAIFDDGVCFAVIGDRHFIVLEYDGNDDVKVLLERFENAAKETLSQQPDFTNIVLENGMGLVITLGNVFSVVEEGHFDASADEIPLVVAMKYREEALRACKNFKVGAIVIPINSKKN